MSTALRKIAEWSRRPKNFGKLLMLPLNIVLNFVLMIPFGIMIFLSFTKWHPLAGVEWWQAPIAGLPNFAKALADARFQWALIRTVIFVAAVVPIEFLLGLGITLLFLGEFRGKKIFTSIALYPMMVPWVVVGLSFFLMFQDFGPVNLILLKAIFGEERIISWFLDPTLAFLTIMLADIWQWTPLMFLIVYSGLVAVPTRLIEAAKVLGASSMQILRRIQLPLIKPLITIALIIRGLEAFKVFDTIFIMTGAGGPGTATETISAYIYKLAIQYNNLSYASAVSLILLVALALVTRVAIRPLVVKPE
ncbi:MAG: carbohydrate ABC transporter permease [Candidatus Bathyarchaeia archaeon]